jgi:hypothetical protein
MISRLINALYFRSSNNIILYHVIKAVKIFLKVADFVPKQIIQFTCDACFNRISCPLSQTRGLQARNTFLSKLMASSDKRS